MTARRSTFRAFWGGTTVAERINRTRDRRRGLTAAAFLLAGSLSLAEPAMGDTLRSSSNSDERTLAAARSQLIRDPSDIGALHDAVRAAVRLGQIDIAAAYVERARQVAPKDAFMIAARGAIAVLRGLPNDGLLLFGQADLAGVAIGEFLPERALGYDLIGDQPSAQYYYAAAHTTAPDDEVLRRYALSLAISGDFATGNAMLRPLLDLQDRGAWRIHAFMLAIDGRPDEAQAVLDSTLPENLAAALAPYMAAMPSLSRAQQAAAANLGIFPKLQGIAGSDGAGGTGPSPGRAQRRRPDGSNAGESGSMPKRRDR